MWRLFIGVQECVTNEFLAFVGVGQTALPDAANGPSEDEEQLKLDGTVRFLVSVAIKELTRHVLAHISGPVLEGCGIYIRLRVSSG